MKRQIAAMALTAIGSGLFTHVGTAQAEELEDLKAMLQKLQARIEQLEQRNVATPVHARADDPKAVKAGVPSLPANSSVTLYGKLDVLAEYEARGSKGSRLALESGGMNGSRWGIKGGADIAEGVRGIFQLEGGIYVNKGSAAQGGLLFGRQAYIGVESKLGTFTVGRHPSLIYTNVLRFDSLDQGYGSPSNSGQVSVGAVRYDSSLLYQSPKLAGFTVSAMAALGGQTGNTGHDTSALAVNYAAGPFATSAVIQHDDHVSTTTATRRQSFIGASYQMAATRIMGGVSTVRLVPDSGSSTHRHEWMIGTRTAMTPTGQLWLGYGRGATDSIDDKSSALSAAWFESISSNANVYGVISRHLNSSASAFVPMGTSSAGSYSINKGDTALGLALGFQYLF